MKGMTKGALALVFGAMMQLVAVAGARVEIPKLGAAAFPDTEVSTNVAFAADEADDLLTVRLTLDAAETNNAFPLYFGSDAHGRRRACPPHSIAANPFPIL